MTRAGFPHSDILGSRFVCQLPEAYRRLQRPSSAPSAKASTLCPYKLDHKDHSKRCSRPLCSSQATTGNQHPHPSAYPHTRRRASGSSERYQPAATRTSTPPTGETPTRSDPERTTFRLFPQDPTACPTDPQPQQPPFPPDPKVGVLGATSSKSRP